MSGHVLSLGKPFIAEDVQIADENLHTLNSQGGRVTVNGRFDSFSYYVFSRVFTVLLLDGIQN